MKKMNEIKALEMITTVGYSVTSNYSSVIQFMRARKDTKIQDIVSFFKNVYARKNEINPKKFDLKFFKGTPAGFAALHFQKYVKERYFEGWILKVSPEGREVERVNKEVSAEKRDALRISKELEIQARINKAVEIALSTNIVKEVAAIEVENNKLVKMDKLANLEKKGIIVRKKAA